VVELAAVKRWRGSQTSYLIDSPDVAVAIKLDGDDDATNDSLSTQKVIQIK
jgi:hypothetical protein